MARILVVEDDEKLNQIMCAYLARSGYQATGCHNTAEAYDLLYAGDYDLILSDIMMPRENDFDFAREIRRQNPQIPILFVTALDDFPSKQRTFLRAWAIIWSSPWTWTKWCCAWARCCAAPMCNRKTVWKSATSCWCAMKWPPMCAVKK